MPHISFSELKAWNTCAHYHKLTYVDRFSLFKGNEFTAFGKAVHDACETGVNALKSDSTTPCLRTLFKENFLKHLQELKDEGVDLRKELVWSMKDQGAVLVEMAIPALEEYFEDFELVSAEERLMEEIPEYEKKKYDFKGFVDLVVKTPNGKVHIIDWKTCGWGWDARKRSDPMITYQLTLYKHFYARKHNLDPRQIETHFALLKRTANKDQVEFFRVTSGPKKTQNALNLLKKALYNIDSKTYLKNRLSCGTCEFFNTEHCK